MRPRNPAEFPDFSATDEPRVQLAIAPPPSSARRTGADDRAALMAELDRLRARAEALVVGEELCGRLGAERAHEALAAIASIRWAVEEGSTRLAQALDVERVPRARRRVAG
jgi:hypothetical protein